MALFNRSSLFVHINKAGGGTVVEAMGATAKELHLRFELSGRHRTLGGFESEATKLGVDVARLRVFTIVRSRSTVRNTRSTPHSGSTRSRPPTAS